MKTMRFSMTALTVALFSGAVLAQMSGGGHEMHGGQPGQGSQQNMAGMSGTMMASQQTMRDADMRMTSAGAQMRDLAAMHATMGGGAQHDQMVSSMQGFLDQMRKVHDGLNGMMKDPMLGQNRDAMKSFQQACRDLDQTARAFESMAKNMNRVMKGAPNAPKK